jgi:O-antigen biosynthesis protein
MADYNYFAEGYRFHLQDPEELIIRGWFQDDNPAGYELGLDFDGKEFTDFQIVKESGMDIRQKYVSRNANIGEEVRIVLHLPENWTSYKKLHVYTLKNKQNTEKIFSCSLSVSEIRKKQSQPDYYLENVSFAEGNISISGWAVSGEKVEISLLDAKGKEIPMQLSRHFRKDVATTYTEREGSFEDGFALKASLSELKKCRLILSAGEKRTEIPLENEITVQPKSKYGKIFSSRYMHKVISYYRRFGLKQSIKRAKEVLSGKATITYAHWMKKYDTTAEELEAQKNVVFAYQPKFSIVVPLYKTKAEYLDALIQSVIANTYTNWELCLADASADEKGSSSLTAKLQEWQKKDERIRFITLPSNDGISENTNRAIEIASGDFIVFSDHDDLLSADALYECTKALNKGREKGEEPDILYSDEDKISMDGKKRFEPNFKPDFSIDFLCSVNYICHLFVVRKSLLDETGYLRREFDGAQDHDLVLRLCEKTDKICHIAKILYHWRSHMDSTAENPESKLYAFEAGAKAVSEHYERLGIPASVEQGIAYGLYRTIYHWEEQPLISILIPNKDHIEDLKKCMNSILERSTYRNFEFIVIENNSMDPVTFEYYKEIEKSEQVKVVYYDGGFNFSAINNFGAKAARGDYYLLLNNDTELLAKDSIADMLGYCMREDVGIVGAKLLYSDETIQHAGVVVGFGGIAGHTFIEKQRGEYGYQARICVAQNYSAVTAACLLVKKEAFEKVNGLTEELAVAFNDVDFCLKVRREGYLLVYDPYAEFYHYESKSRGMEDTPEKVERFGREIASFQQRWPEILRDGDPYYNPNLTLDKADFSLKA